MLFEYTHFYSCFMRMFLHRELLTQFDQQFIKILKSAVETEQKFFCILANKICLCVRWTG